MTELICHLFNVVELMFASWMLHTVAHAIQNCRRRLTLASDVL